VLGVSVVGLTSVTGGVAHLVHQGVMKVTLFYCAGILATSLGVTRVDQLYGVARRQPLTMAAFTVAALGMIGVPPTVGFITKWHLGLGAVEAGQPWVIWILVASTLLNAAYFLPLIARAWLAAPDAEVAAQAVGVAYPARRDGWVRRPRLRFEADPWLLLPPVATGASVLVLGVFAGAPLSPISWAEDIARELLGRL